ncbi:hypothetical protein [Polaromonas naphthalenivorans]|uniref:hypothetical protein n=1 Tax=Polaromonas naphthalenivorans TaxID=216465 RepID=UPI0012ED4949|nr:hypothetical protein [Polaromonas naphthalenivorans]
MKTTIVDVDKLDPSSTRVGALPHRLACCEWQARVQFRPGMAGAGGLTRSVKRAGFPQAARCCPALNVGNLDFGRDGGFVGVS